MPKPLTPTVVRQEITDLYGWALNRIKVAQAHKKVHDEMLRLGEQNTDQKAARYVSPEVTEERVKAQYENQGGQVVDITPKDRTKIATTLNAAPDVSQEKKTSEEEKK